jgi:hypothetical protein
MIRRMKRIRRIVPSWRQGVRTATGPRFFLLLTTKKLSMLSGESPGQRQYERSAESVKSAESIFPF